MNNNTGRNLVFESLVSMAFTQEIEQRTRVRISQSYIMPEMRLSSILTPNLVTVKQKCSGIAMSKLVSMLINHRLIPLNCPSLSLLAMSLLPMRYRLFSNVLTRVCSVSIPVIATIPINHFFTRV